VKSASPAGSSPASPSSSPSASSAPGLAGSSDPRAWARAVPGSRALAFDRAGNLLVGGAEESAEGSVTRFSPTGQPTWSLSLRSTGGGLRLGGAAADGTGAFVLVGTFVGRLEIAGSSFAGGRSDSTWIFVAKIAPDGSLSWGRVYGGSGRSSGRAVAVDTAGNIHFTGTYQREITFGGDAFQSYAFRDVFVTSLDANGKHRFSLPFQSHGPIDAAGTAIGCDDKHVYVAGVVDADFGFGDPDATGHLRDSMFLVGLSLTGDPFFRRIYTGTGTSRADGLFTQGSGGLTVVGSFTETLDIGSTRLLSAGATDALVVHFDPSGSPVWAKSFGGKSYDRADGVVVDPERNAHVLATVTDMIALDPKDFGHGSEDVALVTFDAAGSFRSLRRYGSTAAERAFGIARSAEGALAVGGSFSETLDAGIAGSRVLDAAQGKGFVLRWPSTEPPATKAAQVVLASDPEQALEQAFRAAQQGDVATLGQLVPSRVSAREKHHEWPLVMTAAFAGKADCVSYLLEKGADPNESLASGFTPLMQAARSGHVEAVQALLKGGAKVDTVDARDGTALHVAVDGRKAYPETLRALLAAGAPLESHDGRGRTPLLVAIEARNDESVRVLLDSHADVNASDETKYSALGRAATAGKEELVAELLQRGAQVDVPNDHGWTPLSDAAHGGRMGIAQRLLQKGAHANGPIANKPVTRPLHLAAMGGHTEMVALLLSKDARPDERDEQGRTAAHYAASNGHVEVLRLLRKAGANFSLKDGKGRSVRDDARPGPTATFVREGKR